MAESREPGGRHAFGTSGGDVPSPSVVAAWLVLGMIAGERVPWWTAYWLADGYDGPAMRELAGLGSNDTYTIHDLLPVALAEAGVALPDSDVAAAAACFRHLAGMWRDGLASERWVAQKVEEIVARSDYSVAVMDLPLGHLYGLGDEWDGGWGMTAAELEATVRDACARQLDDNDTGLNSPPLDGALTRAWRDYLAAWQAGNRVATQRILEDFVTELRRSAYTSVFAGWVCRLFFDGSPHWSGQWGGGMTLHKGRYARPESFALSAYPILKQVMVPFLLAGLETEDATRLRWLCQFLIGQGYRIPPSDRQSLLDAVARAYGPDADAMTLLDRSFELSPADPVTNALRDSFRPDEPKP